MSASRNNTKKPGDRKAKNGSNLKPTDLHTQIAYCICKECNEEAGEGTICCDRCNGWFHRVCAGLDEEDFRVLSKPHKAINWLCEDCNKNKDKESKRFSNIEQKMEQLIDMMTEFRGLKKEFDDMKEKFGKLENSLATKSKIDDKVEDMVDAKIQEALDEQRVKESKKLNLIVVNLRESSHTDIKEEKENDKKEVEELIREILPDESIGVYDPIRLGRRNIGNRPRLLRVSVKDEKAKWSIIKNAHKLNQNNRRQHKIYINPDATQKEREEYKKLKEELERRKAEGETYLKIERVGNRRQVVRRIPLEGDGSAARNPQGGQ